MKRAVVSEMPDLPRETHFLACPLCGCVIPRSAMSDTESARYVRVGRGACCDECNQAADMLVHEPCGEVWEGD